MSLALSKCLSKCIKVEKWDYLKNPLRRLENLFVQGSYESLERLEGKTGEGPFFKGSILQNNRVKDIVIFERIIATCTSNFFTKIQNSIHWYISARLVLDIISLVHQRIHSQKRQNQHRSYVDQSTFKFYSTFSIKKFAGIKKVIHVQL